MPKPEIFVFTRTAADSIVRRELGILHFSDLVSTTRIEFQLRDLGYEIHYVDAIFPSESSAQPDALLVSAGLFIPSDEARVELLNEIAKLRPSSGPWFLHRDRLSSNGETIHLKFPLADFGSIQAEFDFGLLASQARFFNSLVFRNNSVTKSTAWLAKGRAEVNFYREIPKELVRFFPKLMGETEDDKIHSYVLELKRSVDLGRHSIQESLSPRDWLALEDRFLEYFRSLPSIAVSAEEIRRQRRHYFVEKMRTRIAEFAQTAVWKEISAAFRSAVGHSFTDRVDLLCDKLESCFAIKTNRNLYFSHGDLCLSNSLFERASHSLHFVDPRGINESSDKYRPEEYDLAKLAQSLHGHYEFILNGRRPSGAWTAAADRLLKSLVQSRNEELSHVLLYSASLYWSLLSLHVDRPDRVYEFMLAGERLLVEGS